MTPQRLHTLGSFLLLGALLPAALRANPAMLYSQTIDGQFYQFDEETLAATGAGFTAATSQNSSLGSFDVNIVAGAGLASNSAALAAFNRAAAQWESYLSDNVTININADLASLGSGILGQASSVMLQAGYTTIRNQMVADNAGGVLAGLTASLPTAAQFSASVPAGFTLSGAIAASKANLKALGFANLDANFGATDATITFSSNFNFDFDNSDGVTAGFFDFETVAAHEIGHALGFFSAVDTIDLMVANSTTGSIGLNPLDLFRFGASQNPTNFAQFTTMARNLRPNTTAYLDQITPIPGTAAELAFSTGAFTGDGRQASHWKDDALTGTYIGLMDPNLAPGVVSPVNRSDLVALDLIGWNVTYVPEHGSSISWWVSGVFILALRRFRRLG